MVLQSKNYCIRCESKYTDWCKPCQISDLKKNFTNWTSGNEKIDKLIQEMQLKINYHDDIIFKWISYNQLNIIEKLNKDNFITTHLAIWKNSSIKYYKDLNYRWKYQRSSELKVTLKCLFDLQKVINKV